MKILIAVNFLYIIHCCLACNGYSAKILKYRNCVDDSIIKLPEKDFDIVLDKDCNIYAVGCVNITKSFKTAKGKYEARKPPLPQFDGELDLCELSGQLKNSPELARSLEAIGIPTKCPVEAKVICGGPDSKMSLRKFKNQIGMAAGKSELKIEIEHDTGKSCIEIFPSVSKARKAARQ